MFEFVFELIDLFFTFYPKSIDIKIVLWNTFENVFNKNIMATCMRKHNLCSLVFFAAASPPLSFLYSTPWTEISKLTISIWNRESSNSLWGLVCFLVKFSLKTNRLYLSKRVQFIVLNLLCLPVVMCTNLTLRNLLRSLVGIMIRSSWGLGWSYLLVKKWVHFVIIWLCKMILFIIWSCKIFFFIIWSCKIIGWGLDPFHYNLVMGNYFVRVFKEPITERQNWGTYNLKENVESAIYKTEEG